MEKLAMDSMNCAWNTSEGCLQLSIPLSPLGSFPLIFELLTNLELRHWKRFFFLTAYMYLFPLNVRNHSWILFFPGGGKKWFMHGVGVLRHFEISCCCCSCCCCDCCCCFCCCYDCCCWKSTINTCHLFTTTRVSEGNAFQFLKLVCLIIIIIII